MTARRRGLCFKRHPVNVGCALTGGGGLIGGQTPGTAKNKRAVPFAGSPNWYAAPETIVRVTSEIPPLGEGNGVKVGVTVAVADPAANSTEVGATSVPVAAIPLHAIPTVKVPVVSPVRVRVNCEDLDTK